MAGSIKSFANNKCKISDITFPMSEITSTKLYAVTSVTVSKEYVDEKATDKVLGINYVLVDPKTFTQIRVKTSATVPVVSQEQIEQSETPVLVEIPINETLVKPYKIEYGKVSLSIVAPYLKLVQVEE